MPVPVRVPDPAGEGRRREIVAAHDRWAADCRAAENACGYTRACEIEVATADALNDAEEAVKLCQPRTLGGLTQKALWVADLLARDAGDDDLAEVFARQVAAFGEVVS